MGDLNSFFEQHDLGIVEIYRSQTDGGFRAIRNSFKRAVMDSIFGSGPTPEAALTDLIAKVNAKPARPAPAPVVKKTEPEPDDLYDDLLG